jgi:predicted Zn-dependent protease
VASGAFVLLKEGDATAALPAVRWAVKEDPKSPILQVMLGQALAITGGREDALAAYRKAAELLPADEEMTKNERLRETYKYLIDKGLKELGPSEIPPKGR